MAVRKKRRVRAQYDADYYSAHREEVLARQAAYYSAHKDERRDYYQENREAIREKDAKEFAVFTEWLQILRTNNGCEDCGTHDGWLEHHHVDPSTKKYSISQMYAYSLDALEEELEKCVVLCRSCHKKRHAAGSGINLEGCDPQWHELARLSQL